MSINENPTGEATKKPRTKKTAEPKDESKDGKPEEPKGSNLEKPKEESSEKPEKNEEATDYKKEEPNFFCKMNKSLPIKGIIETYSKVISETRMVIDKKGIRMTAMDGSHIVLAQLNLKKEDFDEFRLKDEVSIQVGLNLEDLTKLIKRANATDIVTISVFSHIKKFVLGLKPENAKKERTFGLSMIDIDVEDINMESLNGMQYDNTFKIKCEYLDESIKDAEIFSEVLCLQIKNDKLVISTEGSIGDMEYVLEKDELVEPQLTNMLKENSYAIQFLKSIITSELIKLSSMVLIKMKEEAPLFMQFILLGNSELLYFLAPRVEEDTDTMYEE